MNDLPTPRREPQSHRDSGSPPNGRPPPAPEVSPLGYPQRLFAPGTTLASITDEVASIPLARIRSRWWWAAFVVASGLLFLLGIAIAWLFLRGIGIWGVAIPVAWGFAIVNFVWWIGIGHAGTLISAILLLLAQHWRNSINRLAEAMTIFAVMCAGLFPLLHLGRPQVFYFLFPYPDTMKLWPQFRSPLVWDAFAVSTYFTVSLLFWYIGLVPDFATLRDRARSRGMRRFYAILAMGWRGSASHWQRHQTAYLVLAGLATPLVLSVHSVVSLDFAVAILPGWHSTIFPPYFVAGAIYSGFAMVLMLLIPMRRIFSLQSLVTPRHLNNMGVVMLVSGLIVAYGYFMEVFMGLLSHDPYEYAATAARLWGHNWIIFYPVLICNVLIPQVLWSRRVRTSEWLLFATAIVINLGMWLERLMIVVNSLTRDFLPSSWGHYWPTIWDWATFLGTMGLFFTCFLLFLRLAPAISMTDVRELLAPHAAPRPASAPPPAPGPAATIAPRCRESRMSCHGGLIAEFTGAETLLHAVARAREAGYTRLEAYTPYPVEGLAELLGRRRSRLPLAFLLGGLIGGGGGYFMQWYANVIGYPLNVGGRPLHSWPSFIPVTFELTILLASLCGVTALFIAMRLPKLHDPAFAVPGFERASADRFFLRVGGRDTRFADGSGAGVPTRRFLEGLGAVRVQEVPG